ncbi:DegV family protein [Clostridium sp. YIM B02515]|uniref:DegV family protein n=1 Tax=Clostridium rhizosphaerae TaxID=2803861 RepID=A0ABS1TDM2_9CLOT|nr:DegV family protein [Clostridium rhizosphaerae]MBL4937405.1 DegV family protein [Clostridium rhizosphaerae]
MNKIKIFTDSTSDLTPDLIKENDISIIPLYVNFDEKSFKDGVDISTEELYRKVEEYNMLPKTSAAPPAEFYKTFKPYIDDNYDIIFIGLSSALSSHLQNAVLAANQFPEGRIHIVDSLNLSSAIGLLVMKAVDFRNEGLNAFEIAERVKALVPKIKTAFIIDTLDYLFMGGRCSALESFFGGVLKIRPVVKVVDGKMVLGQKLMGKRARALNTMLNSVIKEKGNISPERVMVTHSISNDAGYLKNELNKHIDVKEIIETQAGCVISSHCGPNTIGILYIEK